MEYQFFPLDWEFQVLVTLLTYLPGHEGVVLLSSLNFSLL